MKNCPECSAVLEDSVLRCPYCGSDRPAQMGFFQSYSIDDKTALRRARIALTLAVIALAVNPLFIATFIASGCADKVKKNSNPNNLRVKKICSAASVIAALSIVTSTIIFFGWFINAVIG